uniref:methylcrotonoyl-CoA carboxylase n=1 Tax=Macrostomum lignano TaxID=282301 RepID=A0A1I8GZD3_9PLAT
AALGEVVSADELGGAALHSHTSGCSDHFAGDEAEGFRLMREIAGTLPRPPPPPPAEPPADPMFPSAELASLGLNLLPREGEARRIGLLNILARLLDSSQLLEFKPTFSHGLVCGFGRICGRTVGLMGSWTRLGEKDAVKGAHFLELCGHRGLPLVSLVHTEPDLPEPAGSEALAESAAACLRAKARMMALSAAFPLPRLSLIVGDAAGCDYFLMVRRAGDPRWNSWGVATLMAEEPLQIDAQKMVFKILKASGGRCMSPDFLLAWPNGRLSERLDAAEPGADAFKAAGQLWIDDVIRPAETRLQLDRLLRLSLHYSGLPVHSAGPVAKQQQPSGSRPTYWPMPAYSAVRDGDGQARLRLVASRWGGSGRGRRRLGLLLLLLMVRVLGQGLRVRVGRPVPAQQGVLLLRVLILGLLVSIGAAVMARLLLLLVAGALARPAVVFFQVDGQNVRVLKFLLSVANERSAHLKAGAIGVPRPGLGLLHPGQLNIVHEARVLEHVGPVSEPAAAERALVRPLTRMHRDVPAQVGGGGEPLAAVVALVLGAGPAGLGGPARPASCRLQAAAAAENFLTGGFVCEAAQVQANAVGPVGGDDLPAVLLVVRLRQLVPVHPDVLQQLQHLGGQVRD